VKIKITEISQNVVPTTLINVNNSILKLVIKDVIKYVTLYL